MKGVQLTSRYVLSDYLDEGSCGKIYMVHDLENPTDDQLVAKLVEEKMLFDREV